MRGRRPNQLIRQTSGTVWQSGLYPGSQTVVGKPFVVPIADNVDVIEDHDGQPTTHALASSWLQ